MQPNLATMFSIFHYQMQKLNSFCLPHISYPIWSSLIRSTCSMFIASKYILPALKDIRCRDQYFHTDCFWIKCRAIEKFYPQLCSDLYLGMSFMCWWLAWRYIDSIDIVVVCEKHSTSRHGISGGSMHRVLRLLPSCMQDVHACIF